ncbi:MAG: hypothetical protein AAF653_03690, partial [Chloroflexota bacterium]
WGRPCIKVVVATNNVSNSQLHVSYSEGGKSEEIIVNYLVADMNELNPDVKRLMNRLIEHPIDETTYL